MRNVPLCFLHDLQSYFYFLSITTLLKSVSYISTLFLKFCPTSCSIKSFLPKVTKELSKGQWLIIWPHSSSAILMLHSMGFTLPAAPMDDPHLYFSRIPCPPGQFLFLLLPPENRHLFSGPLLPCLFSFPY